MTPEEQLQQEVNQFSYLVPEYEQSYNCEENMDVLIQYHKEHNIPFTAGSLLSAFMVLRAAGNLKVVVPREDPELVEKRKKYSERAAQLARENDLQHPLAHESHRTIEERAKSERSEKERIEQEDHDRAKRQRESAPEPQPDPIYFEKGAFIGRINHRATEEAITAWKKRTGQL